LETRGDPIASVMASLFARVEGHGAGVVQDDDRTALLLRRTCATRARCQVPT
jgi:hypothetical protein